MEKAARSSASISKPHKVFEQTLKTPLGLAVIKSCDKGLHEIQMIPESSDEKYNPEKCHRSQIGDQTVTWLQEYFQLECNSNEIVKDPKNYPPICWEGLERDKKTEFTLVVLRATLEKVKYGQTVAYSELAVLAGKSGSSRAVGSVMRNNPVPIIIPCHRIIRADGSSGNYSGGKRNDVKKWLIDFEKTNNRSLE